MPRPKPKLEIPAPIADKFNDAEEKILKLRAYQQDLLNQQKEQDKKDRDHRLITNGATAEKYLRCEKMPTEQFKTVLKLMLSGNKFSEFLDSCIARSYEDNSDADSSVSTSSPTVNSSTPANVRPLPQNPPMPENVVQELKEKSMPPSDIYSALNRPAPINTTPAYSSPVSANTTPVYSSPISANSTPAYGSPVAPNTTPAYGSPTAANASQQYQSYLYPNGGRQGS